MAKNKYIDNHFKDESSPLHHEETSTCNAKDIKVFSPGFKYLAPEEKLKIKKGLKKYLIIGATYKVTIHGSEFS